MIEADEKREIDAILVNSDKQSTAVACPAQDCKISGKGLDYIGQLSIDGGATWITPLLVQLTSDRKSFMTIPPLKDMKGLLMKLRDLANTEGLLITK